jgi:hypothetical protein
MYQENLFNINKNKLLLFIDKTNALGFNFMQLLDNWMVLDLPLLQKKKNDGLVQKF